MDNKGGMGLIRCLRKTSIDMNWTHEEEHYEEGGRIGASSHPPHRNKSIVFSSHDISSPKKHTEKKSHQNHQLDLRKKIRKYFKESKIA